MYAYYSHVCVCLVAFTCSVCVHFANDLLRMSESGGREGGREREKERERDGEAIEVYGTEIEGQSCSVCNMHCNIFRVCHIMPSLVACQII